MLLGSSRPLRELAIVIHVIRYLRARPLHLDEELFVLRRRIELLRLSCKAGCDDLHRHVTAYLNKIHRGAAFWVSFDLKIAVVLAVLGRAEDYRRIDEGLAIKALLDRYNDMGDQWWRLVFATVLRILPVKNSW